MFAGVGGFDLGFEQAGYECSWQVEWDSKCREVLAQHWPDAQRYGDVREVSGYTLRPVDVITYGFPCQDLSVAGKRAGLDGDRSNLFFEAIRIIKEMRDATGGQYPKWAVAENVAGLLTADSGSAMGRCLDALAEAGALVIEWATLDAQYWGVAQRRRRVFIAACFDPATAERCGGQIFPVGPGSKRDSATGYPEGQEVAGTLGGSTPGGGSRPDTDRMTFIPAERPFDGRQVVAALTRAGVGTCGADDTQAIAGHVFVAPTDSGGSYWDGGQVSDTLDVSMAVKGQMLPEKRRMFAVLQDVDTSCFDSGFSANSNVFTDGTTPPIKIGSGTSAMPPAVAFTKRKRAQSVDDDESWGEGGPAPTLNAFDNKGESRATAVAVHHTGVRRLTPIECERLQGFPDGWTAQGNKPLADTHRYRMMGNAVCVPVARWVAEKLNEVG